MAGVVLLEENFGRNLFTQVAEDETKAILEYDYIQLAYYKGTQGSVKSTNTEKDWYENKTFKAGYDIFNIELIVTTMSMTLVMTLISQSVMIAV